MSTSDYLERRERVFSDEEYDEYVELGTFYCDMSDLMCVPMDFMWLTSTAEVLLKKVENMLDANGGLCVEVNRLTEENRNLAADLAECMERLGMEMESTCHMEYQTDGMQRGWWQCSKCGEAMDTIKSVCGRKPPKWCGNCGAKVVSE